MKTRFRLFRRSNGIFFVQDNVTNKQESLRTRDGKAATRLVSARNEAHEQPAINRQIAKAYLMVSDPLASTRDWQYVMDSMGANKTGSTAERWRWAVKQKPFDIIRRVKLIETQPDHFLEVLKAGTVSTNVFLRRLHNFALDMDWIPKPIIPRRQWPKIKFKDKNIVTAVDHDKIIAGERNPEWRAYYDLLWHLGGAQSDVASVRAENVDWDMNVISFQRKKTGSIVQFHFGAMVGAILEKLPRAGFLFPRIARMRQADRGIAFTRRCELVGVAGVSLHCYRYAWAVRAKEAGYPERFAQEALGHNSKAVHRAYARKAQMKLPSLEDYESKTQKIVSVEFHAGPAPNHVSQRST
jgi:integrase